MDSSQCTGKGASESERKEWKMPINTRRPLKMVHSLKIVILLIDCRFPLRLIGVALVAALS